MGQMVRITKIVSDGFACAIPLFRELALSALQLRPNPSSLASSGNRQFSGAAGRRRLEVAPVRSRAPHPTY